VLRMQPHAMPHYRTVWVSQSSAEEQLFSSHSCSTDSTVSTPLVANLGVNHSRGFRAFPERKRSRSLYPKLGSDRSSLGKVSYRVRQLTTWPIDHHLHRPQHAHKPSWTSKPSVTRLLSPHHLRTGKWLTVETAINQPSPCVIEVYITKRRKRRLCTTVEDVSVCTQ